MAKLFAALKNPFVNLKALLLGIFIGAVPVANLIILGFGMGEADRVLKGGKKPMKWWHIGIIVHDTLAGLVILLFYLSPALVAALFFLGAPLAEMLSLADQSMIFQKAAWGTSPFELGALSAELGAKFQGIVWQNLLPFAGVALLGLVLYYLTPFALINFKRKERLSAAFDWEVVKKAFRPWVFAYWLIMNLFILALFFFLCLFFFLPVANFLMLGFVMYYASSAGFNLFAQVFEEA